jgi:hypothetical protein
VTDKITTLASLLSSISGSPIVSFGEKPNKINKNVIVYRMIDSTPIYAVNKSAIFEKSRFQLDVYDTSASSNRDLVSKIKLKLDNNSTDFPISYLVNDLFFKDLENNLTRSILDFIIY